MTPTGLGSAGGTKEVEHKDGGYLGFLTELPLSVSGWKITKIQVVN